MRQWPQRPELSAQQLDVALLRRGPLDRRRVLLEPADDPLGEQPAELHAVEVVLVGRPRQTLGAAVRDVRGHHLEAHPRCIGVGGCDVAAGPGPEVPEGERVAGRASGETIDQLLEPRGERLVRRVGRPRHARAHPVRVLRYRRPRDGDRSEEHRRVRADRRQDRSRDGHRERDDEIVRRSEPSERDQRQAG
jgi:hypothetical protein